MSLALARKYRPKTFADVAVQSHVAATLKGAIALGRVAHAYLLCGPRGALLVGDPQTVAEKILFQYEIFRNTRYLIYLMGMPHRTVMRSI